MTSPEPVRFADILTTASAVANYLGSPGVTAAHLLDAIAILSDEKTMEDLGRPVSPLLAGASRGTAPVEPAVQSLVQRWFNMLGANPHAELTAEQLAAFRQDLDALAPDSQGAPGDAEPQ